jgi:gluconolactonase
MANGNALDRYGRLLTCEHATSRVTRTNAGGAIEVLASHYDGKELNSPNDIVVTSGGAIYFTDPTSGRTARYGVERPQQLSFQGVYRIDPDRAALTLLVDDFDKPNGLCFSADESRLFINDTDRAHIRVFQVAPDGTLSGGQVWAELVGTGEGVADGMKIDRDGNLYSCGPGGIHVFAGDATCLGVIGLPEKVANFAWGGGDGRTLFVAASTSLYALAMQVPERSAR